MSLNARITVGLFLTFMVNYAERVAISFAGPSIMTSLSLTPAQFGIVISSFGVGYMLSQIPGGLLADRWGVKPLLVLGPIVWAVCSGITGLMWTLTGFVVARVAMGCAEGICAPSYYKTVGEFVSPRFRPAALSLALSGLLVGMALAGPIVVFLITAAGWRWMFVWLGVPAILVGLSMLWFIPRRGTAIAGDEDRQPDEMRMRRAPDRRGFLLLSSSNMCTDIAQYGFSGWLPSYLFFARGIELKAMGMLGSLPYVFGFIGLLLFGWLSSGPLKRHTAYVLIGCFIAAGASMFAAYQAPSTFMAVAGLCSTAFFMYGTFGPKGASVIRLTPKLARGTYVGFYNTTGQIGGAAAPAIIGFLVGTSGSFASGFAFMIAALTIAAACFAMLVPYLTPASDQERDFALHS